MYILLVSGSFMSKSHKTTSVYYAFAEKEEWYTSSDEFLPYIDELDEEGAWPDKSLLENENIIKNARIKGIKILKEENNIIFNLTADNIEDIEGKDLIYKIISVGFPPRIIIYLYGVRSEDRIIRFFKDMEILGVVLNPFTEVWLTEYVIFFKDWIWCTGLYKGDDHQLKVTYETIKPPYEKGYGVRIADTKIDPLPQVIEVKKKLTKYGLENYLIIASDYETIVLESPFYEKKEEAIEYIESLADFGYKGKLAIRDFRDFPKPNRFEVVSGIAITRGDNTNLENIVNTEWTPEKIYNLSYYEIYTVTKGFFSPSMQSDEVEMSEYYYTLSEIYRNYDTENEDIRKKAITVTIKILELIYYIYPESPRADDALWDIANIIREYAINDILEEEDCYRIILEEYPESIFLEEAEIRIKVIEESSTDQLLEEKDLKGIK